MAASAHTRVSLNFLDTEREIFTTRTRAATLPCSKNVCFPSENKALRMCTARTARRWEAERICSFQLEAVKR